MILLDEPTGGINPTFVNQLSERIRTLHQRRVTFLIVEHNKEFVMELCDAVTVLHRGVNIAEGPPKEVRENSAVRCLFGRLNRHLTYDQHSYHFEERV